MGFRFSCGSLLRNFDSWSRFPRKPRFYVFLVLPLISTRAKGVLRKLVRSKQPNQSSFKRTICSITCAEVVIVLAVGQAANCSAGEGAQSTAHLTVRFRSAKTGQRQQVTGNNLLAGSRCRNSAKQCKRSGERVNRKPDYSGQCVRVERGAADSAEREPTCCGLCEWPQSQLPCGQL